MLYLITEEQTEYGGHKYHMFETHTESTILGGSARVRALVNTCKIEPKNMQITRKEIRIKQWPHSLWEPNSVSSIYTLLANIDNQKFKLLRYNGEIVYMDELELMTSIELNEIVNCSIENGRYKSIDTYSIKVDTEFEKDIAQKYKTFMAKSTMLGLDLRFVYTIENKEVKLMQYLGRSSKVILPNFITTIIRGAFSSSRITEIKLNEGLKYIGTNAFAYNNLTQIEIPKTVKFVEYDAFLRNYSLINTSGEFRDTIKKLSGKTVLLR